MYFKADLKDAVLRGLILAELRAKGLICQEDANNPAILFLTNGEASIILGVLEGKVVIDRPSFFHDFIKENPASRILIVMILMLAIGAYFFSLQLVLAIPLLVLLYLYIFYRSYQTTKAEYDAQTDLYEFVIRILASSLFLTVIREGGGGGAPAPDKKPLHPAIKFILFLIILFAVGAFFVGRELLVMLPILLLVYALVSIKLYRDSLPPKPEPEPESEEEEQEESEEDDDGEADDSED